MDPKMQPAAVPATPTRAATVAIDFNQTTLPNGKKKDVWTFTPDEIHMTYDASGQAPDTITFNFTDSSGSGYKLTGFSFELPNGTSVPGIIDDWSVAAYASGLMTKTFNDTDHNTGTTDKQINYCVTIMKADGSTKKNDPKIWNTKGSG